MGNKDNNHNEKRGIGAFIVALILGLGSIVGWLMVRMKPEDRKTMIEKVEHGVQSLMTKAHNHFFPNKANEYKPHFFRKESVAKILFVVLAVKIVTVSTLFILFPNEAKLNRDVTSRMYSLINEYRADVGTHPLESNPYLESVALAKANDMIEHNYFSHFGVDGMKPWEWIDTSVYDYRAMGENLAMDFVTAGAVFKAFQNSPTHDKNLINEKYTNIGIAVRSGYLDGHETNIMVVFFGAPRDASIPTQVASAATVEPGTSAETGIETVAGIESEPEPVSEQTNPIAPVPVEPEPTQPTPVELEPIPEPTDPVSPEPGPTEPLEDPQPIQEPIAPESDQQPAMAPVEDQIGADVEIAANTVSSGVVFSQGSFIQRMISWSDRFLGIALIVVIALMIINLVVKIRVQHASIIANGFILIAVISVLLYANVHKVEAVGQKVKILGMYFM